VFGVFDVNGIFDDLELIFFDQRENFGDMSHSFLSEAYGLQSIAVENAKSVVRIAEPYAGR
jgi:hypothetical protein